jgi:hypothetical protein
MEREQPRIASRSSCAVFPFFTYMRYESHAETYESYDAPENNEDGFHKISSIQSLLRIIGQEFCPETTAEMHLQRSHRCTSFEIIQASSLNGGCTGWEAFNPRSPKQRSINIDHYGGGARSGASNRHADWLFEASKGEVRNLYIHLLGAPEPATRGMHVVWTQWFGTSRSAPLLTAPH